MVWLVTKERVLGFSIKVLFNYLFIYLAMPGFTCSMWDLYCGTQDLVLTRDQTLVPCIGSTES